MNSEWESQVTALVSPVEFRLTKDEEKTTTHKARKPRVRSNIMASEVYEEIIHASFYRMGP